jgi:hypothetical protein
MTPLAISLGSLHDDVALAQGPGSNVPPRPGHKFIDTPLAARRKLAGLYTLARYAPHGDKPRGRIYYDVAGRMNAMIDPPGRKLLSSSPTVEEYRDFLRGMIAYYGTYSVDESTSRVIHHVEAASNPIWTGTDLVRWYELQGNRLLIRTTEVATASTNVLTWERLPDR